MISLTLYLSNQFRKLEVITFACIHHSHVEIQCRHILSDTRDNLKFLSSEYRPNIIVVKGKNIIEG